MFKIRTEPQKEYDPEFKNGYAPYPAALIISTERSGVNFVRHIVESLTPFRTPGKPHIHKNGSLVFHRTHYVNTKQISPARAPVVDENGKDIYSHIVLLLRDPREIFVRAYEKDISKMHQYIENIQYFNTFDGNKILIYYDDLVSDNEALYHLFSFLNIEEYYDSDRIDFLREESLHWYDNYQKYGSMTKGKAENLQMHQKAITPNEMLTLTSYLKNNLNTQEQQYLARWDIFSND